MNDNRHWPDNTGYSQSDWKVTEKERKLYNDMRNDPDRLEGYRTTRSSPLPDDHPFKARLDDTCDCDDCQREREGKPEPNPLGFAFLMLTLLVLAGISFWRIFS